MLWVVLLLLSGLLVLCLLLCTPQRMDNTRLDLSNSHRDVLVLIREASTVYLIEIFLDERQRNEPPLDRGYIPWLGHALAFGRDTAGFLARMKDKHGDIFTILVAGRHLTVLLDPNCFDSVLLDTTSLEFPQSRLNLIKRIFGLETSESTRLSKGDWLRKNLQHHELSRLSGLALDHLQNLFLKRESNGMPAEWREEGLFELCCCLLFRAGYSAMLEEEDNVDAVYREFRRFEGFLPKMARGTLGRGEKKAAASCLEHLQALLSSARPGKGSEVNGSSLVRRFLQFLQDDGMDSDMRSRAAVLLLWSAQTNPGPAVFWLLGFLLTHPEAMEAVRVEIRGLQERWKNAHLSKLETQQPTPVLDSVLKETLRLTSAVLITRDVVQRKTLRLSDDQEYVLREGNMVLLLPFLSPQMDPHIHPEPQNFKYDRFLNADLTEKTQFCKKEHRVKYSTLPWGAGLSQCPATEFALQFLKHFVLLFLTHVDVEVCESGATMPPVNSQRFGFGILHPEGDLQIRYRFKGARP